jgi:hypothetical protein
MSPPAPEKRTGVAGSLNNFSAKMGYVQILLGLFCHKILLLETIY